jgi:hypothetical protein
VGKFRSSACRAVEVLHEAAEGRALAAGNDQPVQAAQLAAGAYLPDIDVEAVENGLVFDEIALEGQDTDGSRSHFSPILEQTLHLVPRHSRLAKNARHCALRQLRVIGQDDHELAIVNPFLELDVAPSLRDDIESTATQRAQNLSRAPQSSH